MVDEIIKRYINKKLNILIIEIGYSISKEDDIFYNCWFNYKDLKTNIIKYDGQVVFKDALFVFERTEKINKIRNKHSY